jgi:hypothetical protein
LKMNYSLMRRVIAQLVCVWRQAPRGNLVRLPGLPKQGPRAHPHGQFAGAAPADRLASMYTKRGVGANIAACFGLRV